MTLLEAVAFFGPMIACASFAVIFLAVCFRQEDGDLTLSKRQD